MGKVHKKKYRSWQELIAAGVIKMAPSKDESVQNNEKKAVVNDDQLPEIGSEKNGLVDDVTYARMVRTAELFQAGWPMQANIRTKK